MFWLEIIGTPCWDGLQFSGDVAHRQGKFAERKEAAEIDRILAEIRNGEAG
jgi:hypothetical protein